MELCAPWPSGASTWNLPMLSTAATVSSPAGAREERGHDSGIDPIVGPKSRRAALRQRPVDSHTLERLRVHGALTRPRSPRSPSSDGYAGMVTSVPQIAGGVSGRVHGFVAGVSPPRFVIAAAVQDDPAMTNRRGRRVILSDHWRRRDDGHGGDDRYRP